MEIPVEKEDFYHSGQSGVWVDGRDRGLEWHMKEIA